MDLRDLTGYGPFVVALERSARLQDKLRHQAPFASWVKYKEIMRSIKDRRDLFIHQNYLSLIPVTSHWFSRPNAGTVSIQFGTPEVIRRSRDAYDIDHDTILHYNYFCRAGLYALLKVLQEAFSFLE